MRIRKKSSIFAPEIGKYVKKIMNAVQVNADILRNLGVIAEDETMLDKVAKYIRRVARQMTEDSTCMSKEEYFRRLDEAEKGPKHKMLPNETLDEMLIRLGYV